MDTHKMCKASASVPHHPPQDGFLKWTVLHECGLQSQILLPIGKNVRPKMVECKCKIDSESDVENIKSGTDSVYIKKSDVIRISLI